MKVNLRGVVLKSDVYEVSMSLDILLRVNSTACLTPGLAMLVKTDAVNQFVYRPYHLSDPAS